MVFSFRKRGWFEIDRTTGKKLFLGTSVYTTEGATYNYGFDNDGYVYRLEYGNTMDGTAIPFQIRFGDIAINEGSVAGETTVEYHGLIGKAKTNTSNGITITHYIDGSTSGKSETFSPNKTNYRLTMDVKHKTDTGVFHSWDISTSTDDESYGFEPLYYVILYHQARDNTRDRRK
jgi:hypothetical protein